MPGLGLGLQEDSIVAEGERAFHIVFAGELSGLRAAEKGMVVGLVVLAGVDIAVGVAMELG